MYYSAPVHSLFAQLQTRFPTSTLVTELVQIQEGQYVVRALVQVGGAILTTAMAAAPAIEQAEDRARVRVLMVLGITVDTGGAALPEIAPLLNGPGSSSQAFETENRLPLPTPAALRTEVKPEEPPPPLPTYQPLETFANFSRDEDLSPSDEGMEEPEEVPEFDEVYDGGDDDAGEEFAAPIAPSAFPAATTKSRSQSLSDRPAPARPVKPEPAIASVAEEPEDLSSLIALTDIEMDRIGWTKQQGRDYLKRTYRKSTRQKLEVDELMDFLNYLRALPSANGL